MGALIDLRTERERRCTPTHCVRYDSERATQMFGEAFRTQRLYFWSKAEAEAFASENRLGDGPAVVEPF